MFPLFHRGILDHQILRHHMLVNAELAAKVIGAVCPILLNSATEIVDQSQIRNTVISILKNPGWKKNLINVVSEE